MTASPTTVREPRPLTAVPESSRPDLSARLVDPIMEASGLDIHYGDFHAVRDVDLGFGEHEITALIGPSGCGKSSVLRSLNRMNDLVPGARVTGRVTYRGQDVYAKGVDPIAVRTHVGMVFQKPNPFPKSIFDNVAYGPRVTGMDVADMDVLVEQALRRAALWDEVKDKLKQSAYSLSGGQQQRLCIARAIATEPEVILMDEPCSALDPIATARIEELMAELRRDYTIIIGGKNFGCGSSREHAPLAIAEAGATCVVAEFYARIFFRNCVNGGYLVPFETDTPLVKEIKTGDELVIDVQKSTLTNVTQGNKTYQLKPLGDVAPIIEAGGVFDYAKQSGMLAK